MRRAPSPPLLRQLAAVPPEEQATSSISLGELLYGARRVPDRSAELLARIEQTVTANLPVLPFDGDAAAEYGALRAQLEGQGALIGNADMQMRPSTWREIWSWSPAMCGNAGACPHSLSRTGCCERALSKGMSRARLDWAPTGSRYRRAGRRRVWVQGWSEAYSPKCQNHPGRPGGKPSSRS